MEAKEFTLNTMKKYGKEMALQLQAKSPDMSGTELYQEEDVIPEFVHAAAKQNMIERDPGFICKSSAGRVVKLLQKYDSSVHTQEPEELPAQWGFAWSTDPAKALPFIAISTSPYMIDDCCTFEGDTFKSVIDNNVHSPADYPAGWEKVTE